MHNFSPLMHRFYSIVLEKWYKPMIWLDKKNIVMSEWCNVFVERVNQGESLVSWLNWLTEPPAVCWSVIMGDLSANWKGVFWTLSKAFRTGPPSCPVHSMNGLTSTPFSSCPAYFSNLQYAMIENQKLILDDTPLFISENHLIYLSLRHCSIQNIPRSTFVGLFHLKMLNISHNDISLFEKETFHDLTNLTVLRIDNNALTTLDTSVFHQLKSLQYLYLSGNHLSSIDGGVAILSSLRFIDLSFNNLTVVRRELFRNSPLLTYIEFKYNSISNIESGAFANMTSFVAIGAATNDLIYINPCKWIDGVAKIMTLALAYNNISSVEGLECLPYLQVFNLFDNELSIMPLLRNHVYLEISSLVLMQYTLYQVTKLLQ